MGWRSLHLEMEKLLLRRDALGQRSLSVLEVLESSGHAYVFGTVSITQGNFLSLIVRVTGFAPRSVLFSRLHHGLPFSCPHRHLHWLCFSPTLLQADTPTRSVPPPPSLLAARRAAFIFPHGIWPPSHMIRSFLISEFFASFLLAAFILTVASCFYFPCCNIGP